MIFDFSGTHDRSVSIFAQGPSGILLDFIGPKITCLVGLAMFLPGSFLFAYSSTSFNAYLASFLLLSAGGPFVFVSIMPSANLFPSQTGLVMMMINGAYGGGALVFFVFLRLFNQYNTSIKELFIGYGILGGVIAILVAIFWPMKKYKPAREIVPDRAENEAATPTSPGERAIAKSRVILKDVFTFHYLFLALFIPYSILKTNFMLSTIVQQLTVFAPNDPDQVNNYNAVFGILIPGPSI